MQPDRLKLIPLPLLTTRESGVGFGVAVCHILGVAVTSDTDDNVLDIFTIPADSSAKGFVHTGTLGGTGSPPLMQFKFIDELGCGNDGTTLAVADSDNRRVSLFKVADGAFVRHLATGLRCPMDVEQCEDDGDGRSGWAQTPWNLWVAMTVLTRRSSWIRSCVDPQPWPKCLAWAWWCGTTTTTVGDCRYLRPRMTSPWGPCPRFAFHGWRQWPGPGLFISSL